MAAGNLPLVFKSFANFMLLDVSMYRIWKEEEGPK